MKHNCKRLTANPFCSKDYKLSWSIWRV